MPHQSRPTIIHRPPKSLPRILAVHCLRPTDRRIPNNRSKHQRQCGRNTHLPGCSISTSLSHLMAAPTMQLHSEREWSFAELDLIRVGWPFRVLWCRCSSSTSQRPKINWTIGLRNQEIVPMRVNPPGLDRTVCLRDLKSFHDLTGLKRSVGLIELKSSCLRSCCLLQVEDSYKFVIGLQESP